MEIVSRPTFTPRNSLAVRIPALHTKFPMINVPATVEIPENTELNEFSNLTVALVNVAP